MVPNTALWGSGLGFCLHPCKQQEALSFASAQARAWQAACLEDVKWD